MSPLRVEVLRLVLPACHRRNTAPVRCVWRLPSGDWHSAEYGEMSAIAGRYLPRRVELCLHPADSPLTEVALPPLPPGRLRPAVSGAIELLTQASPERLAIGYGTRSATGMVPLAWSACETPAYWASELARHGLRVDAVYPLPAFLPEPPQEMVSTMLLDDWMAVRTGPGTGALLPLPAGSSAPERLAIHLNVDHSACHWLNPAIAEHWSGTRWDWSLPVTGHRPEGTPPGWLRPALLWGSAATAVWLLGLTLYAGRLEQDGMALKRQMVAEVKAAFPQVPVVLNPLQQARQLSEARKSGNAAVEEGDFAALLRACAPLLTQSAGQVASLAYQHGQLQLRWREGSVLKASELETLQAQARERGLLVEPDDGGVRFRVAPRDPNRTAAPPAGETRHD